MTRWCLATYSLAITYLDSSCLKNMENSNDINSNAKGNYWQESLRILWGILFIWFLVSFGCGILFKDYLDSKSIGGAPLGFWMAQQGSIFCFVGLLIAYSFAMNRLDKKHGFTEEE